MSAERLRVLQLIKTLDISGAERYGTEIARALPKSRFEVQVCGFFETGSELEKHWRHVLDEEGIGNFTATTWLGNDNFSSYMRGVKTLRTAMRAWPADVVHSHFQLGTLAGLDLRGRGLTRKVIRTAHNHARTEWSAGWYGWLRRWLVAGLLYPAALDVETSVSDAIAEGLRRNPGARFARRPPVVVKSAVSAEFIERALKTPRTPRPPGEYLIGSVGRLTAQKNYGLLLSAMPAVLEKLPGVKLHLIGDGDQTAALENQALQAGLADSVSFLGRRSDVAEQMRQWDLFVLPSLYEGLPAVLIESMACQTPVLATDIPGMRELVQPEVTGWLVPPGQAMLLAEKIVEVLSHPEERERVNKNAFAQLPQFTFPYVAQRYAELYEEILKP